MDRRAFVRYGGLGFAAGALAAGGPALWPGRAEGLAPVLPSETLGTPPPETPDGDPVVPPGAVFVDDSIPPPPGAPTIAGRLGPLVAYVPVVTTGIGGRTLLAWQKPAGSAGTMTFQAAVNWWTTAALSGPASFEIHFYKGTPTSTVWLIGYRWPRLNRAAWYVAGVPGGDRAELPASFAAGQYLQVVLYGSGGGSLSTNAPSVMHVT